MEQRELVSGHFYFLRMEQLQALCLESSNALMANKDSGRGRPCLMAVQDPKTNLFWMVPISSKIEKYEKIAEQKGHRRRNTLVFHDFLERKTTFLIQNMFPVTAAFVSNEYRQNQKPLTIAPSAYRDIEQKVLGTIEAVRHGAQKLIFPDILFMEKVLLAQLREKTPLTLLQPDTSAEYVGEVVAIRGVGVIQLVGGQLVHHQPSFLDQIPEENSFVSVSYCKGRGFVREAKASELTRDQELSRG